MGRWIAGLPDNQLERIHWNYGGGRGALGYRHLPSGITVIRECSAVPVVQVEEQLRAELKERLQSAGLLDNEEPHDSPA
jgi:hypothetical protein